MSISRTVAILMLGVVVSGGCQKTPAPINKVIQSASSKPVEMIKTGMSVRGRIVWTGDLPKVEGFNAPHSPLSEHAGKPKFPRQNPCAPEIDLETRGVQSAVVFLNHAPKVEAFAFPPVKVVLDKFQMKVQQDGCESRFGFVKPGEPFQIVNQQDFFFTVRGRGDAFFSIPLTTRNHSYQRKTEKPGMVTLSSGSGQFWMRSFLFSVDHPWISRCDGQGRFEISDLPEGKHELIAWIPNWNVLDHEIDAETWETNRLEFAPPLEKRFEVEVTRGTTLGLKTLSVTEREFARKPL